MDAITFLKEYHRMCGTVGECGKCPAYVEDAYPLCEYIDPGKEKEFVDVVKKWSQDHPVITNRMKFKEMFGWELMDPISCRFYHDKSCDHFAYDKIICRNCPWWDEPYEPKGEKNE